VRADRLLSMLLLLQARGRMPAPRLARELEVSERTVYRDVEALSAAGVPVYTERGRNGGVVLLPGHRTDVAQLSALSVDEARALFAYGGRGGPDDAALRSGLRKLLAALPATQRTHGQRAGERVVVDWTGWRRPPEDVPALGAVREAVWADERLRLRYRSSGSPQTRAYTVDPYGLLAKAGVWYLIAAHQGRPRLFRVGRIERAVRTGDPASRPAALDLQALWQRLRADLEEAPAAVEVRLVVRAERTAMLLRIVAAQLAGPPGQPVPDRRPGWDRLDLQFRALGAARGVLLGLGTDVEVLSPGELRDDLAATARAVLDLYEPTSCHPPVPRQNSIQGR
jgi:predicted DNA-binding transcriptional regulator YafY